MKTDNNIKIAIVGRPNVGKSSLFNRILGSRRAIVEPASGTTRDRLYASIKFKDKHFTIVDTGGFEQSKGENIPAMVLKQLLHAIDEADIIFFVTDGSFGLHAQDIELASRVRKLTKKIFLLVNKIDDKSAEWKAAQFHKLGLGDPYAVSAVNNIGITEVLDEAAKDIAYAASNTAAPVVSVAIVGRPNVGKSSFLNALLKEERAIVHHVAGTTRDSLDTDLAHNGKNIRLIDTAGIRHNKRIERSADFYGSVRSKEAIKRADIAFVIIDALDGLREDDERVVDFCIEQGKALVLIVNKWDLVKNTEMAKYKEMLFKKMAVLRKYPVIFISAKSARNVDAVLEFIEPISEKTNKWFDDKKLSVINDMLNNSREIRNRRIKFEYIKQKSANPPGFILGIKNPKLTNENLKRYVENFLRDACDFQGLPIKITFEKRIIKK